jgi:hypothetical protein
MENPWRRQPDTVAERVLLLKAHRAAGKLTGAASAALSVAAAARRRVAAGRTDADADDAGAAPPGESPALRTRFYGFLRASLVLSMLLLAVDVAAHLQGWHLAVDVPDLLAVEGLFAAGYASWVRVRLEYLAPALQFMANACVVLFLIQSADRLILCLGCLWIKLKGIKPAPKAAGKGSDDVEAGTTGEFPMVLVQIPMCNEKEVSWKQKQTKFSILCPIPLLGCVRGRIWGLGLECPSRIGGCRDRKIRFSS